MKMTSYRRKPDAAHYDARRRRRRAPRRIEEELKMVIDHLIPATPDGHEWLWEETQRVLDKYPDLREKVNRWLKEERDEGEEEIKRILSEWEAAKKGERNPG